MCYEDVIEEWAKYEEKEDDAPEENVA